MTVSDQIIQVLDSLCEKFGMAIDWTNDNVVPYITMLCEKLISWEIWSSVAWIAVMIILVVASVIATKICYPTFKNGWIENSRTYDIGWQVASIFAIIGLIILYITALVMFITQTMDIIKCITFPEMYVFEYIQGVINGAA